MKNFTGEKKYRHHGSENYMTGFTLIEMLVVLAIVGVLTTAVFFGYRSFSDRLQVSAASQDVSIAVRQAQIYGESVKQSGLNTGNFSVGYGVYFDLTSPESYSIFSDGNDDGIYNGDATCASGGDCLIEKDILQNNVKITSFCGVSLSGGTCSTVAATGLSIVFIRPNPDALITFSNSAGNPIGGTYQSAQITLQSSGGSQSLVTIGLTGLISIH